jgi:hAT family C-terminal dimerisation region
VEGLAEESINQSVLLCQQICSAISCSIQCYVGKQPSWRFFEAARVFDPRIISGSVDVLTHDIAHYKAIPWLMKDMNNQKLLEEWSIYIAQVQGELQPYTNVDSNAVEHFDVCRYWNDRRTSLPRLAGHALRTLDVPVSSADAERACSSYNKLVCSSRLSLSDESVRALHSAAWNGDICGRFRGYDDY